MNFKILSSRIFTGNPEQPWAEALCCRDDRIAAIGTNSQINAIDGTCETFELHGRLVTPGFVDAHTHLTTFGMTLRWVDLNNLTSVEACREQIREAAAKIAPGAWLIGRGWNHHLWPGEQEPNRHDLDDLLPNNPAMMIRTCGHSVWVNSKALEQSNITCNTPDPSGGRIDRDEHGNPTGILREARQLIEEHIPPLTRDDLKQAVRSAQDVMLRFGLTGVRTMESFAPWEAVSELDKENGLKLRVYHLVSPDHLEQGIAAGLAPGKGSEHVWGGQVKLFADGSLGAATAFLHEPYTDEPANCGLPYLTTEQLQDCTERAYQNGFDVAIHAIGDRAFTNSLDAIEAARKKYPGAWRDSIEHVQLVRTQDLERCRALGITASIQPRFIMTDYKVASAKWGLDRCRNAYALRNVLQHDIPLQFSSDTPVETCDPRHGLYAAVTRQTPDSNPVGGWFPDQCLTLAEAIKGYTSRHAWVTHRDWDLGMLSLGRTKEWFAVDTEMTIVNGDIAYHV
ncbi:amidohydrolase [candidate division KSB3 bacterium]|uniref:Amidohydrolase n=1 Tax=candidate division KSB3 bacterium TaxID=2044937 RepID=A0A2G6KA34_9BACT|nr:MAG: amidohydrolase [candidate division KSB3 bacterium]